MMTFFMEPEGRAAACSSTVSGHPPPAAIAALPPTDPQCRASERRSEHFRILQKAVAIFVRQMQMLGGQSDMKMYLIDYARLYNHAQARVVDLMLTMENMGLMTRHQPQMVAMVMAGGLTLTKLLLLPNVLLLSRMERASVMAMTF